MTSFHSNGSGLRGEKNPQFDVSKQTRRAIGPNAFGMQPLEARERGQTNSLFLLLLRRLLLLLSSSSFKFSKAS
jgi:hypothetical protein